MTKRLRISGAVSFWCDKFQFVGLFAAEGGLGPLA